jgi:hypothetical protein
MGTRADFYIGKDDKAEWLGSIAWDGNRDAMPDELMQAHSEVGFRQALEDFFAADRDDVTLPPMGWPWPWVTSATTDCAYFFFDGRVWDVRGDANRMDVYVPCDEPEPEEDTPEGNAWLQNRDPVHYPDMSKLQSVTLGKRSGLIVIRGQE